MVAQSKLKECFFCLVRYVPDAVRGEFVNIGLFLHSPEEKYLGCLFTDDFERLKRFHRRADLELLRELQQHFEEEIDEHGEDLESYIRNMQESFSNLIQVSEPRTCLLEDPQSEIQDLFARYVGARMSGPPPTDTRLRIKQRLTAAFVVAGVWERLEKRIPAAQWTAKGDPFTFDFGYKPLRVTGKPNGHTKLVHALSLKRDSDLAKVLAFTIDRVRRKERAELTAIVEALPATDDEAAAFNQRILEQAEIHLQPLDRLGEYAQAVRAELLQ